jgi:hypothetical protein
MADKFDFDGLTLSMFELAESMNKVGNREEFRRYIRSEEADTKLLKTYFMVFSIACDAGEHSRAVINDPDLDIMPTGELLRNTEWIFNEVQAAAKERKIDLGPRPKDYVTDKQKAKADRDAKATIAALRARHVHSRKEH